MITNEQIDNYIDMLIQNGIVEVVGDEFRFTKQVAIQLFKELSFYDKEFCSRKIFYSCVSKALMKFLPESILVSEHDKQVITELLNRYCEHLYKQIDQILKMEIIDIRSL